MLRPLDQPPTPPQCVTRPRATSHTLSVQSAVAQQMNESEFLFDLHELKEEIRHFVIEVSVFPARTQRVYLIRVKDLSAFIIIHFKIKKNKYFNCWFIYILVFPEKLS